MNVTKLVGWQGVQRDLAKLPYLIDQKKFFIAVFRKSGNIIKKKAKSLVPVDEGILKKQ